MKKLHLLGIIFILLSIMGCSSDDDNSGVPTTDPIIGLWDIYKIGETDVTQIPCYQDSYMNFDPNEVTIYLLDRTEDGTCVEEVNGIAPWENRNGVYYINNDIYNFSVSNNMLTWVVSEDLTITYRRQQ